MTDYREDIYSDYGTIFSQTHSLSTEEFEHYARAAASWLGAYLPKDTNSAVLDVGCGAGHILYFLKKQGYKNCLGIDISSGQLEAARRSGLNVEKADFTKFLPEREGQFDLITSFDLIEHLKKEEILNFLKLIHSALKPGGRLIIGTPNGSTLFSGRGRYVDFTHEVLFTPESFREVFQITRYKVISIMGEVPVALDMRSAIRTGLWWAVKGLLKCYLFISEGTGRGMWKSERVLEPRLIAIADRTASDEK